jgi:prepilin-type N-terminal cleavage/methylation domain-containing protein
VSSEKGFSLVELLVTMVILSVVIGGLTTVFISGSTAQINLNERFQAQQNARLALDRLRVDIHCATAAQAQTINGYPGIKLSMTMAGGATTCYSSTVSYCVVQYSASPIRYQLFRATGTGATDCTASDATRLLIADYLTSSSVFTTNVIPQYSLQTVGIDIKVGVHPGATAKNAYELTDSIVVRNSTRCAPVSPATTCAITAVP